MHSSNNRTSNMLTGLVMAAGFCVYIAATWMYGQKEDQA
ncbi:hypothetical protein HNP31_000113 [Acinetobacter johnsonii]|nr:hypothetical protein [Acinetobacter johnsonii]